MWRSRFSRGMFVIWVAVTLSVASYAKPSLSPIFGDHMVLQQGRPVTLWGWADPGEKIAVTLLERKAATVADLHGKWSVSLPALGPGGPYTITIAGKRTIYIKDVLVGEVWVASGQSNMTYALSASKGGAEEVAKADFPQLRLFRVPLNLRSTPQDNMTPAKWQICTPETAKDFSAVAYYFARNLHQKLGIPVGIIQTAWPGTTIEEWMPQSAFEADSDLRNIPAAWNSMPPEVKKYVDTPAPFDLEFRDFELLDKGNSEPSANHAPAPHWTYDWDAAPGTFFEESPTETNVRVHGVLSHPDQSLLRGSWNSDRSPTDLSSAAGLRFWVRGNGAFRVRFLQPSITDTDDYASPFFSVTEQWQAVTIRFSDLRQEGWGVVREFTPESQIGIGIESVTNLKYPPRPPGGLFNAMIAPLLRTSIRGAIWYQGESNALRAELYRKELPAMISAWREEWKQGDFPFLIVQLPNHGAVPQNPGESAWAELREAQFDTLLKVPNTGLAVTIDVGEPDNVHPSRKLEVGERLALWALANSYQKQLVYSGPLFHAAVLEGDHIRLDFTNLGSGLAARDGGTLTGFAVAGEDRRFYWAQAKIAGDQIIVSAPEVPSPVAVRYAWGDSPTCNLIDREGLPASPFRTDRWPGITAAK